jgi:hypothetical protein
VHRTEAVYTTLNPDWLPFRLKVGALCNGDYDRYPCLITTTNKVKGTVISSIFYIHDFHGTFLVMKTVEYQVIIVARRKCRNLGETFFQPHIPAKAEKYIMLLVQLLDVDE